MSNDWWCIPGGFIVSTVNRIAWRSRNLAASRGRQVTIRTFEFFPVGRHEAAITIVLPHVSIIIFLLHSKSESCRWRARYSWQAIVLFHNHEP